MISIHSGYGIVLYRYWYSDDKRYMYVYGLSWLLGKWYLPQPSWRARALVLFTSQIHAKREIITGVEILYGACQQQVQYSKYSIYMYSLNGHHYIYIYVYIIAIFTYFDATFHFWIYENGIIHMRFPNGFTWSLTAATYPCHAQLVRASVCPSAFPVQ